MSFFELVHPEERHAARNLHLYVFFAPFIIFPDQYHSSELIQRDSAATLTYTRLKQKGDDEKWALCALVSHLSAVIHPPD